ncbi:hypothetical protein [Cytobacillus sp. IB215665]|uniref:hypothetical protein n=1 Tax=Cytobacillus sp. IB215665 TaxID=3097357 RepID=UPI002A10B1C5|nr:hypothetical protein [Cytobacillus sp. IB215665]MDX8366913.1 hypothetical protein [Cytobacillus sp. IB215665]
MEVRLRGGGVHRGIVDSVTPSHVYIRPMGPGPRRFGGYGLGFVGGGYGGFGGFGGAAAVAAVAIVGIVAITALAFAFFW